jgi:glycosyltransferase involved in cell wall biosynthesis
MLLYLSNNRFPTEKAHGLQIAKTCESFIKQLSKESSDEQDSDEPLLFVGPKRIQTTCVTTESPQEFYKLDCEIPVKRIWSLDLLQKSWMPGASAYMLQSLTFLLNFALQKRKLSRTKTGKDTCTSYTRSILIPLAFLFSKDLWLFEAHTFPKTPLGQAYQRWLLKKSRGLVCISQGLAEKYKKLLGKSCPPIHIAHDGVDLDAFQNTPSQTQARKELNLPLDKKIILYTGSPFPWKGVFTLADGIAKIAENTDTLTIFLGGNPDESYFKDLQNHLKKIAPTNNLADTNALALPFVPYEQVPLYMAAADILVIPNSAKNPISREDTSPLKLFEYMASGKEILASAVPALQNVLTEKEAWFFTPDDPTSLAQTLQKILSQTAKDPSNKKGPAAAALAANYSWSQRTKGILNFISKI